MEANSLRLKALEECFLKTGSLRLVEIYFPRICLKKFLFQGLHIGSLEFLLSLISVRFGASLRYIELPIELITHTVFHELSGKCPNLTHMLLDFSTGERISISGRNET